MDLSTVATIASTVTAVVSLTMSGSALYFARNANQESRRSRNMAAVMEIHQRHMTDQVRDIRRRLLYTDEFDGITIGSPGAEDLHHLFGLYELLGTLTRHGIVDTDIVIALFPGSVPRTYQRGRRYIELYRAGHGHPAYAANLQWLAERYPATEPAPGAPRPRTDAEATGGDD